MVQPKETGYVRYLDARTGAFVDPTPFTDKITWIKGYDANGRPIDMVALPGRRRRPRERYPARLLGGVDVYAYETEDRQLLPRGDDAGMKYKIRGHQGHQQRTSLRRVSGVLWHGRQGGQCGQRPGSVAQRRQARLRRRHADHGRRHQVYTTQGGGFTVANTKTGEVLFTVNLGTAAKSGPATYTANGKQVLVQALGGTPGFGRDEAWQPSSAACSSPSPWSEAVSRRFSRR